MDEPAPLGGQGEAWVARAETALRDGDDAGVEVFPGSRPSLLDAGLTRGLAAPLLAGIVWAGAIFREQVALTPLDPIALLLRFIALGLTIRVVLLFITWTKRFRLLTRAERYAFALTEEGLLLRTPFADYAIARADAVSVRASGEGGAAAKAFELYLVTRPSTGRIYLRLPPVFGESPAIFAEHLMRWLRPAASSEREQFETPADELPSKTYDAAARGNPPAGTTAIPHGRRWIRSGPYSALLLGVAALDGFLRVPSTSMVNVGLGLPVVLIACVLLVPLLFWARTRRAVAPRRGLAMVLTPRDILIRAARGVISIPYASVSRVSIDGRPSWSLLEGYHIARKLIIARRPDGAVRYDEAFLGVPAEVALELIEAYRSGRLP